MHRKQLLQHFETLAETPEAVEKLRAFVLDLAVRGRLVHQASKPDKDATWQKFCRELDAQVHNTKTISRFEIPDRWHWVVVGAVAEPCGQKKPDKRFTYVDVGSIDNVRGLITPNVQVLNADEAPSRARKLVRANSVIYSTVRPYLRNIAVIEQEFEPPAIVSTAFAVLHPKPFLNSRFLFYWLRSAPFQEDVAAKMKGVAYPAISDSEFWECPIPVPPPEEQRRIVAKVEELLALCDELEARQTAAREHRSRLVRSALDRLTTANGVRPSPVAATSARATITGNSNAPFPRHAAAPEDGRTPDDFQRDAAFVLREFPQLTAAPEDVPALRQAILSLAVQGRLVPRNPKEGHGGEVLDKFSLCELPDPDNILDLTLPAHWAITSFSNLVRIRSGVTKGRNLTGCKTKAFPYLRVANVQRGYLDLDVMKDIEIPVEELEKFRLEARDLLVTEGGDWDKVGRTAIWREEIADCIHQNHVFRARLVAEELKPEWFMLYLNSPVGRRYFESAAKQTTNLASINATELRGCPVPIPPFAEQQRIVAKVDELMRWCDALEARLTAAQTTATHLLDATLRRILDRTVKGEL